MRERHSQFCLHVSRVRLQDKINLAKSTFHLELFLFLTLGFYFDFMNVNWLRAVKNVSVQSVKIILS